MYSNLFSPESIEELTAALQTQFLPAIWETFYVTLLSTAFAIVIGLPLGVLLVAGERDGVLPLPRWLMSVLNVLINLLRSIPFLILMIMVFPLSPHHRHDRRHQGDHRSARHRSLSVRRASCREQPA